MRIETNISKDDNRHELQMIQQQIQNNSQASVGFSQGHESMIDQMNQMRVQMPIYNLNGELQREGDIILAQRETQVSNQIEMQLAAQNQQLFQQLNNHLDQQAIIPTIIIPRYKYYAELCILGVGLGQVLFGNYIFIHVVWMIWFVIFGGFKRHVVGLHQVRFFAELGNLALWLLSNIYIFAGHSNTPITLLPILVVIQNFDYYFSGSSLVLSYVYFTVFTCCRCFANIKLRKIQRKLKNRRKILIEKMLAEFEKNQLHENDKRNNTQGLSFGHNQDEHNICSICLQQLKANTNCNMFDSNIKQTSERQSISTIDSSSNSKVLLLNCKHRFHTQCIKQWIVMDNMKCPICRRSI